MCIVTRNCTKGYKKPAFGSSGKEKLNSAERKWVCPESSVCKYLSRKLSVQAVWVKKTQRNHDTVTVGTEYRSG